MSAADGYDVLVVGAGVAGAATALTAARGGRRVLVLAKGALGDGATAWAQGGLAVALAPGDSPAAHARDTLAAGAGLCDEAAVRALVTGAPVVLAALRRAGARFDGIAGGPVGPDEPLALTREGGHGADRVVHAGGDASGAEVSRTLLAALPGAGVELAPYVVALDVLLDERGAVAGLLVADVAPGGALTAVRELRAPQVVLATGGFGQAYATTTNPAGATGAGLGLALRAGAAVADVEFVQFHPTVLRQGPGAQGQQVLVSEAVRGEGAVLVDATGRRVTAGVHPLGDLAPRDVVAAAIDARMTATGTECVYLDATGLGRDLLERRFPTVLAACRARGVDPVTEPVPVVPAAHYACGGVLADLDGRTGVAGLSAVGEVAATGVHGANRLASNSLVEGLVAGTRTGVRLAAVPLTAPSGAVTASGGWVRVDPAGRSATAAGTSRGAGVVRTGSGLTALLERLAAVAGTRGTAAGTRSLGELEAAELHLVSRLVATAAAERMESRGCHRRADAPATRPEEVRRVVLRLAEEQVVVAPERRAA